MRRRTPSPLARAALAAWALGLAAPWAVSASLEAGNGGPPATFGAAHLGPDGKSVVVTAGLGCAEGELYQLRVRLNQRSTATLAAGRTHGVCTAEREQELTVGLSVHPGHGALEPGDVRVLGLVTTRAVPGGAVTDAHQWQGDLEVE